MSLIEVLISALIVILIAAAVSSALVSGSHFTGDQRLRSQAHMLAAQDQERLRGLSDQQLATLRDQQRTVTLRSTDGTVTVPGTNQTTTVPGTAFTVKSVASLVDVNGNPSCTSNAVAYWRTVSTVSWTEGYTTRPASIAEESIISRPVGGNLLTQVTDEKVQGLPGVTVNASGPSSASTLTDDNGCAVFAGLTPGDYIVTMSDPGYVDPDANSTPSGTAKVQSLGMAKTNGSPFHMGLAGSVVASFTTPAGGNGETDSVSWLGSGAAFGMSKFQSSAPLSGPTVGTITTGSLFPFWRPSPTNYSNNYTVWAGRCLQMEPPAATTANQVTVASGALNQRVSTLQEPQMNVTVQYTSGSSTSQVKPAHIRLTYNRIAGDTTCGSYTWSPTLNPSLGPTAPTGGWLAYGQPFVSNQSSGANASAASTTGAPQTAGYTVCADYSGYKSQVTAYNNNMSAATAVTITIVKGTNSGNCP